MKAGYGLASPGTWSRGCGDQVDLVVSLYRREGHGPAAGWRDHVREATDAALTAAQLADVHELAEIVAGPSATGRRSSAGAAPDSTGPASCFQEMSGCRVE